MTITLFQGMDVILHAKLKIIGFAILKPSLASLFVEMDLHFELRMKLVTIVT